MKNTVILGIQWGDEGKGKIVDFLSSNFDAVVRFQGGSNAGHTLIYKKNRKIILHLIPSGIFYKNISCYIGNGVVLNPKDLIQEIHKLEKLNINVLNKLNISSNCPLVLPTHILLDQAYEKKKGLKSIGTTGKGIGPAYEDKVARRAIKVIDLFDEKKFEEKIRDVIDYHNFILKDFFKMNEVSFKKIFEEYMNFSDILKSITTDVIADLNNLIKKGKSILFEGAQGSLLDIDHGTYPFVTSSNTNIGSVMIGSGIGLKNIQNIIGVVKSYTTRVGKGPFPTMINDSIGDYLVKKGNEFGSTTKRKRSCGWFDAVLTKRYIDLNSINGLVITKLDVLDQLEEIKICVAYKNLKGNIIDVPKYIETNLSDYEPIYEVLPGWKKSLSNIKKINDLPKNARAYIDRISKLLNVPIKIISIGPEREKTILV